MKMSLCEARSHEKDHRVKAGCHAALLADHDNLGNISSAVTGTLSCWYAAVLLLKLSVHDARK
jgi:hypothetical protein